MAPDPRDHRPASDGILDVPRGTLNQMIGLPEFRRFWVRSARSILGQHPHGGLRAVQSHTIALVEIHTLG